MILEDQGSLPPHAWVDRPQGTLLPLPPEANVVQKVQLGNAMLTPSLRRQPHRSTKATSKKRVSQNLEPK